MEWMILPLRHYAQFTGRSRRREFWAFVLLLFVARLVINAAFGSSSSDNIAFGVSYSFSLNGPGQQLQNLLWLATLVPSLAVATRRLHDVDRSGWWLLLIFVPLFGWLILLVFYCLDGTSGNNRFGTDPKGRGLSDVFG